MFLKCARVCALVVAAPAFVLAGQVGVSAETSETPASPKPYSKQGFLDAVHVNCAEVQNRKPRSCKCEKQLIDSDRLTDSEKEMTFYFYTNKAEFKKRFEANKAADPDYPAAFSKKFTELQALIISACGK